MRPLPTNLKVDGIVIPGSFHTTILACEPASTPRVSNTFEYTTGRPSSNHRSTSSATDSSTSFAVASEETAPPAQPESYPDAVDITDFVENLLDDTNLFHNITQSNLDAIEVCKSYAFDPSPLNYHVSETDEFLREYIAKNRGREFYQKYGLIASLAFDYLGIHNYKCGLGLQHLCRIDCPKVVNSIEDLETARRVYFALTSASNFLSISNMVYVSSITSRVLLLALTFRRMASSPLRAMSASWRPR